MQKVSVSHIVNILVKEEFLLEQHTWFADQLGVPPAYKPQWIYMYRFGNMTSYTLLSNLLNSWVSKNGAKANVAELCRILDSNNFKNATDNLRSEFPLIATVTSDVGGLLGSPSIIRFGVKPPTRYFVGREKELGQLEQIFKAGIQPGVLLRALGGTGKTELARKFIDMIPQRYPKTGFNIAWLPGETEEMLHSSIAGFGKLFHGESENKRLQEVPTGEAELLRRIDSIANNKDEFFIVVIDNVDEIYEGFKDLAAKIVDRKKTFLIVTSRRRDIPPRTLRRIDLHQLTEEDSMELVKRQLHLGSEGSSSTDSAISALCRALGNFPLALQQAVAYINNQKAIQLYGDSYSIHDYLRELEATDGAGVGLMESDELVFINSNNKATLKVWDVTINHLQNKCGRVGAKAVEILNVIAYLNPDEIRIDFLLDLCCNIGNHLGEEAISRLRIFSLVEVEDRNGKMSLSIHRLVQMAVRCRCRSRSVLRVGGPLFSVTDTREYSLLDAILGRIELKGVENPEDIPNILTLWKYACKIEKLVEQHVQLPFDIYSELNFWGYEHLRGRFVRDSYSALGSRKILGEGTLCVVLLRLIAVDFNPFLYRVVRDKGIKLLSCENMQVLAEICIKEYQAGYLPDSLPIERFNSLINSVVEVHACTLLQMPEFGGVYELLDSIIDPKVYLEVLKILVEILDGLDCDGNGDGDAKYKNLLICLKEELAFVMFHRGYYQEARELFGEIFHWQRDCRRVDHRRTLWVRYFIGCCEFRVGAPRDLEAENYLRRACHRLGECSLSKYVKSLYVEVENTARKNKKKLACILQ